MKMNYYTYFFLNQIFINNDLTLKIPDDCKEQLLDLNMLNVDNADVVKEYISNNNIYYSAYQENGINIYDLDYLTLEYKYYKKQTTDDIINVAVTFEDSFNHRVLETYDLEELADNRGSNDKFKFNPTMQGADKVSVTFRVPDNADTLSISMSGNSSILFKDVVLYNGIPQLVKSITPALVSSRLAKKFYDEILPTISVSFDVPSASSFINNVRAMKVQQLNRGLFYLIQLTCLELIAISYYYKNDKTQFNLLSFNDFRRIQTNLNVIKNRIVRYDKGKYLINSLDNLINAFGYLETAFKASTNNLNLREH